MKDEIEELSAQIHLVYCAYYLKRHGVTYWTKGNYDLLDEETKEADRFMARFILERERKQPSSSSNTSLPCVEGVTGSLAMASPVPQQDDKQWPEKSPCVYCGELVIEEKEYTTVRICQKCWDDFKLSSKYESVSKPTPTEGKLVPLNEEDLYREIRMCTSVSGEFFGGMFVERLMSKLSAPDVPSEILKVYKKYNKTKDGDLHFDSYSELEEFAYEINLAIRNLLTKGKGV
jgi:hypothetical protein